MLPIKAQDFVSPNDAEIELALQHIQDGNVGAGVATLQALAEDGDALAMFHVAEIHRLGIGRAPSIPIATMYYRFAATLGHKRASLSLANILFFDGTGSESEMKEALEIWQTLALEGNLEAAYMLGMLYWNGEGGLHRDPIRGFALVWLSFENGYEDAEQNLLSMRALLSTNAKEAAYAYAKDLQNQGFSSKQLAPDLLEAKESRVADYASADGAAPAATAAGDAAPEAAVAAAAPATAPAPVEEEDEPLVKPDDWTEVWRLEVGFAMSELETQRLETVINTSLGHAVGDLYSEVTESPSRPGLYRLIYGPAESMSDAVSRCVTLKRAGHDCFARPPEEDSDDDYDYE